MQSMMPFDIAPMCDFAIVQLRCKKEGMMTEKNGCAATESAVKVQ